MGNTIQSINPATEETIAEYAETSESELEHCLQTAEEAFEAWRKLKFAERAERLINLAARLQQRKAELARLASLEMGKPVSQAEAEVEKCASVCEFYAHNGGRILERKNVTTDAKESWVQNDPLGPILAIMPWNLPYWQVFRAAVPAIASGNVVVLKHANNVCGVASETAKLFSEAGFPEGVFSVVFLSRERAEHLVASPAIRGVTLTGSERAGRAVAAKAGEHIKPTVLELGGSDPFIVLADADLSKVVPKAVQARTQNTGQSCIAAKRFLVDQAVIGDFQEQFVKQMMQIKVGNPLNKNTDAGPLARSDLRDQLHRQVLETIQAGGRLACGGRNLPGKGWFYEPTVLTDVAPGMPAFDDETFGPVAAVVPFRDISEAIQLANRSSFGLGASLWTTQPDNAIELSSEISAGAVFLNEIVKSDPRIPFGGIKNSGYGRELGEDGMLAFVNRKTVWVG
ncbi:NAD-dependent succinate-semialdehyde dehydrogenase [Thalassoroseus pseudoceratinae]|uniref:NAD-dependent succinate-semialdehyde dehydrogenase n=1 Tax=Thalassoroseus pseudoceratinae TaxID=2713176 RepID=UPI0014241DD8|nr:NAD-dependent succinate-semialdehyde dehydrogenase [Thalassoroseus pseudoceratinae]